MSLPATLLASLLACLALLATPARAHDIPGDVRVQAFLKPEGQRLSLLVRVPLGAMNEVELPLRGPGYIDLARADDALKVAARLWLGDNITVSENGRALPFPDIALARVALASDRSFATWEEALATARSPRLPDGMDLPWAQQQLDVLLVYPITAERSDFTLEPRLARLGLKVRVALRFLPPGGPARAFEFHGNPGPIDLDPSWRQAALRFVAAGFAHILDGTDHLLFIACLAIPCRRLRPLAVIATAFTAAHSITLAAAAFGHLPGGLWFPPLVETLIAASIVFMALEGILGASLRRRWILAFAFGLVHGFGFAFALREALQFAGDHLVASLVAFNLGVELGQLGVLLMLAPALRLLFRFVPERAGTVVLSALVAHAGWHWMTERWEALSKFPVPTIDAAAGAQLLRWVMAAIVLAVLVGLADARVRRWLGPAESADPPG